MNARDQRPRLGRGLAALWGDTPAEDAGTVPLAVQVLSTDVLEPNPFQPRGRVEPEKLDELAQSIRAHGILQALLVRPHPVKSGGYQIVAGERRWRAAQEIGLHEVPALVRELTDAEVIGAALVENLQREDLNGIEEADGYLRLMREFGLTQDSVALMVGKSRSHVANMLRLLNLPELVKQDVRRGALTAGHARALLGVADPQAVALDVIARGLSVRQTEALSASRVPRTSPSLVDENVAHSVQQELTERLGLRVQITFDGKGGMIRIRYRSLDQLDGVITLLRSG